MGVDRRRGAIVLMFFWQVGLDIVEIWNFELVDAREKHRWLRDCVELYLCDLVHRLQFAYLLCEVRRVVRDSG